MICITIWVFRFFYFASQRTPKMQGQLPSFERKMPCGFRIRRRIRNHLGHFAYPPGETSQARHPSSRVRRRRGLLLLMRRNRHCFFEPKCRPLRCSSSGYRGAHHRVTAGGARSSGPITSVRQVRRALGNLARISQIFAISCQLSRALAISKTTHCILSSTADKGQEYG